MAIGPVKPIKIIGCPPKNAQMSRDIAWPKSVSTILIFPWEYLFTRTAKMRDGLSWDTNTRNLPIELRSNAYVFKMVFTVYPSAKSDAYHLERLRMSFFKSAKRGFFFSFLGLGFFYNAHRTKRYTGSWIRTAIFARLWMISDFVLAWKRSL